MIEAVLFDLGGTLVRYYDRRQFPDILRDAITRVQLKLQIEGELKVEPDTVWLRVREEDYESEDYRVRPLEDRLTRIFELHDADADTLMEHCRTFMEPIFALGRLYDDAIPILRELTSMGVKTAVVSNTPWGSPAELWREEMRLLGLKGLTDALIFCRDVGWRKPARQIFELALEMMDSTPDQCLFVGDDPRWDVIGPESVGIEAVLIQREEEPGNLVTDTIGSLQEIFKKL